MPTPEKSQSARGGLANRECYHGYHRRRSYRFGFATSGNRGATTVPALRRADAWDALQAHESTPILLAVRNDDLADVLARVPDHRRKDLLFLQNGMLRPWLAENGLQHATRGLIFFAVAKRGDVPRSGGESPLCGPHAAAVAAWLNAIGLPAREVDAAAFASVELEKLCGIQSLACSAKRFSVPLMM